MNEFIETIKARLLDAQKRTQAAQQRLALVQAEFQAASQELNSWNFALATEMRRVQEGEAAAQAAATPRSPSPAEPEPNQPIAAAPTPINNLPDINKTETVRDLLRQRPTGMTPKEIWKELEAQIRDRAYIYSILKRLKDRDEVTRRRGGRYAFKHQPQPGSEEVAAQNGVVQQH